MKNILKRDYEKFNRKCENLIIKNLTIDNIECGELGTCYHCNTIVGKLQIWLDKFYKYEKVYAVSLSFDINEKEKLLDIFGENYFKANINPFSGKMCIYAFEGMQDRAYIQLYDVITALTDDEPQE